MFYGSEYTSKECIFCFLLGGVFFKCQSGQINWLCLFKSFICSLIFCPLVLSIIEGGVLKSQTITAVITITSVYFSHCGIPLIFTLCYSEAFLVGAPVFGGHDFLPINRFIKKKKTFIPGSSFALKSPDTHLLYLDPWSVRLTYLYFHIWSRLLIGSYGWVLLFHPTC